MTTIVWLRQDLRLKDNALWQEAAARGEPVIALYVLPHRWRQPGISGLDRAGAAKAGFIAQCLGDIRRQLAALSVPLVDVIADPETVLARLARLPTMEIITAPAQAPEERQWLARAHKLGIRTATVETQSLFSAAQAIPAGKPFPDTFSRFRRAVEKAEELVPAEPACPPVSLPSGAPVPEVLTGLPGAQAWLETRQNGHTHAVPALAGGETAALAHLAAYLADTNAVRRYKQTRNHLTGDRFCSRLSGYLSTGALSARTVWHALLNWEAQHGASNGSYWLRFELLWREFFHWSLRQHDAALFRYTGLSGAEGRQHPPLSSRQRDFWSRWCNAETGLPCIDAPLTELMCSGWTSNRARQLLASFLVYEMRMDWRWGAEFFQHYLLDDDVASNWGNWAYIAGVGHDARGGRQFAILEQTFRHDPDAHHIRTWLPQLDSLTTAQLQQRHRADSDAPRPAGYPRAMLTLCGAYSDIVCTKNL